MNLPREVTGSGPTNSPILIVGEAPGSEELERKIPFVGPSGKLLRQKLHQNGLDPSTLRFENVIERKLPGNDISSLYLDTAHILPHPELSAWFADLHARIASLSPKAILAVGDTALHALTGKTREKTKSGIGLYHCTPLSTPTGIPVVPVYHPAYILRNYDALPWLNLGIKKLRRILAQEKDLTRTPCLHRTLETVQTLPSILLSDSATLLSIDIEILQYELACISFAVWDKDSSSITAHEIPISIPGGSFWTAEDEVEVWKIIATLCASPNPKVFQNFIFDVMWLSKLGIRVQGKIHDTMLAAAFLHPELPKGLADLSRIYTLAPAWKKEFDWGSVVDPDDLYTYNALDAAITLEIHSCQERELLSKGKSQVYEERILALIPKVKEMCEFGWRIDEDALSSLALEAKKKLEEAQVSLAKVAESFSLPEFNPNSPLQVKDLLSRMGMRVPLKDGKETTSRLAMLKLARRNADDPFFPVFMDFKKVSKLHSTYANVKLDHDRRLRFSVNMGGTKSGRFSSSQTPWDTGLNSQNVPSRDPHDPFNFRHVVVPDAGCTFLQLDLAQAEARIVAWLAEEEAMEEVFDHGGDVHTRTACLVFGEDITKLPDDERKRKRYLGKKCVHAFNYGMAEGTFADSCLMEGGLALSVSEAKRLRDAYFQAFPKVLLWQRRIQEEVRRTRKLTTPYGRERAFHSRLTDDLFREAYSFIPQSTVVDYLNEGWVRLDGVRVIQQGHDSLLMQIPLCEEDQIVSRVSSTFSNLTFTLRGRERKIPFSLSSGSNWRDLA